MNNQHRASTSLYKLSPNRIRNNIAAACIGKLDDSSLILARMIASQQQPTFSGFLRLQIQFVRALRKRMLRLDDLFPPVLVYDFHEAARASGKYLNTAQRVVREAKR